MHHADDDLRPVYNQLRVRLTYSMDHSTQVGPLTPPLPTGLPGAPVVQPAPFAPPRQWIGPPPTQVIGRTVTPATAAPEPVSRPKQALAQAATVFGGFGGFALARLLYQLDPLLALIAILVLIGLAALLARPSRKEPGPSC